MSGAGVLRGRVVFWRRLAWVSPVFERRRSIDLSAEVEEGFLRVDEDIVVLILEARPFEGATQEREHMGLPSGRPAREAF